MTMPARVAAIVAIGALILAGVAVIGGAGRSGPAPSSAPASVAAVAPSAAPSPSPIALPALDQSFTSPRHGYTVKVPTGWTVTPATEPWPQGSQAPQWGDPNADEIKGSSLGSTHPSGDVRLIGTQQGLADGQTDDAWLQAYCDCPDPGSLPTTKVAGYTGYITADGLPAADGTIMPGGTFYDVAVPVSPRGYVFTLDGNVDRAMLDAFLSTVSFQPYNAIDTPTLTDRFTSSTYGYSIGTLPAWTVTPSTKAWTDVTNDSAAMDGIDGTGADGIGAASQPLGDRTFVKFLAAFEAEQHAAGCGGGDPATWESIPIGDQTGVFYDACGSAEALVQAGDRVYLFELGHGPSGAGETFSVAEFKQLLTSVIFDPASAK